MLLFSRVKDWLTQLAGPNAKFTFSLAEDEFRDDLKLPIFLSLSLYIYPLFFLGKISDIFEKHPKTDRQETTCP